MNHVNGPGPIRRLALLGNHTPRQCGIATFTADLRQALSQRFPAMDCLVAAMNDGGKQYAYPAWVRLGIAQDERISYRRAAESLNARAVDVVSLQHEFGIFGGPAGAYLLDLLRDLRMPVVTTLHTVLDQPNPQQWAVLDEVIRRSQRLVVMSAQGAELLRQLHGVPAGKIEVIAHGIPLVPEQGPAKLALGYGRRPLLLTFGLLAPDKGLEYVIEAMPAVLEQVPDAVYLVLGATHPQVLASQGEAYRNRLEARVQALGVAGAVHFQNRFVGLEELTQTLAAADIYLTPYLKMEQITSGTLAYAVGAGKAVISTPFRYAQELLAQGRGRLVPVADPAALAREIRELLADGPGTRAMCQRAAALGQEMLWPAVAGRYQECFQRALLGFRGQPVGRSRLRGAESSGGGELRELRG